MNNFYPELAEGPSIRPALPRAWQARKFGERVRSRADPLAGLLLGLLDPMRLNRLKFETSFQATDPIEEEKKRAMALASSGKIDAAIELLSVRLQQAPSRTDLLLAIARILLTAERYLEAIEVLLVLEAHLPRQGEVLKMLGTVYGQTRQASKALEKLTAAKALLPTDADLLVSLAKANEQLGNQEASIREINAAIRLRPKDPLLRCTAAAQLHHCGRSEEAGAILTEDPEIASLPYVRLLEAMLFPVVPNSVGEIMERREHFRQVLVDLAERGDVFDEPEKKLIQTNFLLGYHGLADRELIELYAETVQKICPSLRYVSPRLSREPPQGRRLRVGFVSSNMRTHSVGRVLNRFLTELDRERFEVLLFELPGKFEGGQQAARAAADKTIFLTAELHRARKLIEDEVPDILVFPDFVLDPANDRLAFSRLAPVQCSTWGHPGTSGRDSMDYWISCEDWEPLGNERFYTEELVRFKLPPMIATPLKPPTDLVSREELGLPSGTLYGCPQSIYKIHPEFDDFFAEILRRDHDGFVVVIGGAQPYWLEQFRTRFSAKHGDVADRIVMLPHLDTNRYLSLLSHCSVSLDPIHFGGANTTMEAFMMGLPVVTWPGDQLRNRQTLSFYRMMGLMDLVVDSKEAYVDLAIRVANDGAYRSCLSQLLRDRCAVIFDTVQVTRELEDFFEGAVAKAAGSQPC